MAHSVKDDIQKGWNLLRDGKEEEALQIINQIEKQRVFNSEEELECILLKSRVYRQFGKFSEIIQISDLAYPESLKIERYDLALKFLVSKIIALTFLFKPEEANETIKQAENLVTSLPKDLREEFSEEISYSKAAINGPKGWLAFGEGDLDQSIKLFRQSIDFFEKNENFYPEMCGYLTKIGIVYRVKGELNNALNSVEKSHSLIKGRSHWAKETKAANLRIMGAFKYEKGNYDQALVLYEQVLALTDDTIKNLNIHLAYYNLAKIALAKQSLDLAKHYFKRYEQYMENIRASIDKDYQSPFFLITKARVLKSSYRIRDWVQTEKLLKQINEEQMAPHIKAEGLLELCSYYLKELQVSNHVEVFDEIRLVMNDLLEITKNLHSYPIHTNVYLLQGKLALIQQKPVEARKFLTQAQNIADEHGYVTLANWISIEHDRLLDQLENWEKPEKSEVSFEERLKAVAIDETIKQLIENRTIDPPEITKEEPILLLIMGKGGISYFNHAFMENWDYADLFSSFMSAFNTFSSEIFSKTIDRIKIGENTILVYPIEQFLTSYVIKGQSFTAQKKLRRFSEEIKNDIDVWTALNKSVSTSEVLEIDQLPSLKTLLNEIFIV
jgi:tetratricopeptide (TPR) repeat protein